MKLQLDRRTLLRGLLGGVGVSVGLPVLDAMLNESGTAMANGSPIPLRFGVFYWGGGVIHSRWLPKQTGTNWDLSDSLTPFGASQGGVNLQPYMTLLSGLNHAGSSPGHIPARGLALSSSHDMNRGVQGVGTFRGQNHPEASVDNIVADAWKGDTTFEHIAIGICRKGPYKSNSSWRIGGKTYNRHEPSPQKLYERLFQGMAFTPSDQNPGLLDAASALERSMLDAVMEDTSKLSKKLGYIDRQRLEQHLEGLRSIERQLVARQNMAQNPIMCESPDEPTRADFGDGSTREEKGPKSKLMSDMLAVALACDLSRVFSYEWSATQSEAHYHEVGLAKKAHHEFTHVGPDDEQAKIIRFIMENFAYLGRSLERVPVGDGNLLDHTLILGTSEHASARRHNYNDHPYLLLGKAGGSIKAGMHYRREGGNNDAPKVLLTAVRAVGVKRDALGQTGGSTNRRVSSTITEIEA